MSSILLAALVRDELARMHAYEVPRPPDVRAKLDANESPWPLPPEVAAALGRELASVALHRYPAADAGELRAVVAADLGVDPATLCFGNGSDELIAMMVAAFSRPRSGRQRAAVLFPSPSFVYYRMATAIAGLDAVEVPLDAEMRLDEPAVAAALAATRPNLAFFARPNNPTGGLWPAAAVLRTAREYPDTLVIDDEAYLEYGGDSLVDSCRELPNLVIMRTLSKIGMAALRIGYVHAHPDVIRELEKVRPPYNLGSLNQRAAAWLLSSQRDLLREHAARVAAERDRVFAALSKLPGLHPFDSRANLILFRVGTAGDGRATAVWRALAARGVLVRTFDAPGPLSGCLRVSIGTPEENDLFLAVLAEVL